MICKAAAAAKSDLQSVLCKLLEKLTLQQALQQQLPLAHIFCSWVL